MARAFLIRDQGRQPRADQSAAHDFGRQRRGFDAAALAVAIEPRAMLDNVKQFLAQLDLLDDAELVERLPVLLELLPLVRPGRLNLLRRKLRPQVSLVARLPAATTLAPPAG